MEDTPHGEVQQWECKMEHIASSCN